MSFSINNIKNYVSINNIKKNYEKDNFRNVCTINYFVCAACSSDDHDHDCEHCHIEHL